MRWILGLTLLLAACGTTSGRQSSAPLRIASWNMEHLAEANDSGCRPRTDADYAALRTFAEQMNADVVAFQEVESAAAAARVFDPGKYSVVIEDRVGSGGRLECRGLPGKFLNRQATGFAIRNGVPFTRNADYTDLQTGNPDLRSGVDITVRPASRLPVRLLSVHLKSGCASGTTNEACADLMRQAPVLERWIDARASSSQAFVVLGDFNRRLAGSGDVVWADWDDGNPSGADLSLAEGQVTPRCDPRYREFIDHIVFGVRLAGRNSDFREWTYSGERLSDHCPVSVTLR